MQLYKIVRYVIRDLLRSRWTYVYFAFYYLLGMVLLFINRDLSKAVITLMNMQHVAFLVEGRLYFDGSLEELKQRTGTDTLEQSIAEIIKRNYAAV